MKRTRIMRIALVAGLCLALQDVSVQAAISTTGNVTPGLPWNSSTIGYIGETGTGSLLVDNVGANRELNTFVGVLGYASGASGTATVTGAGTKWESTFGVYVGYEGNGTLEILDGASFLGNTGEIASVAGCIGRITVSGTDSFWYSSRICAGNQGTGTFEVLNGAVADVEDVYIGDSGVGTLTISGGVLTSEFGQLGYRSGSCGTATVHGADSSWEISGFLGVGSSGDSTLEISAGGTVLSGSASVGHGGATGEVTVTGSGSVWQNGGEMKIGSSGSGVLNILDGAAVFSAGPVQVTKYASDTGTIHFDNGTLVTPALMAKESHISGTGTIYTRSLSPLFADQNLVLDDPSALEVVFLLNNRPTQNVTVHSEFFDSPDMDLYTGYEGNGSLAIRNGVEVSCRTTYLGYQAGSIGSMTVSGENSILNNDNGLYVGRAGLGSLAIQNGGTVNTKSACEIGYEEGATGVVHVSGANTTWNTGSIRLGYRGNGSLQISDGAVVNGHSATLGYFGSVANTATIDNGSTWNNSGNMVIGYRGIGSFAIQGGSTVTCNGGFISQQGSYTSTVVVNGTNSSWTNAGALYVGGTNAYSGKGVLEISNSASVTNQNGYVGIMNGSIGLVTVRNGGSTWTNHGDLSVGVNGTGSVIIERGGNVQCQNAFLEASEGSSCVTVSGDTSSLNVGGNLSVSGALNYDSQGTLEITDGAMVDVGGYTWIATRPQSMGKIRFDGGTLNTRSLCATPSDLAGTGTINTRGLLSDVDLVFDAAHGLHQTLVFQEQMNQNITVDLDLSDSNNLGVLGVGFKGEGSLTIRDGVVVQSGDSWLGYNASTVGTATVSGAGSTWNSNGYLHVGGNSVSAWLIGGKGILEITNQGTVHCKSSVLGVKEPSEGHVRVAGMGSTWTIDNALSVGSEGVGVLEVAGGATVSNGSTAYVGASGKGFATVTGAGSTWDIGDKLYVGNYDRGTLKILDGGAVTCNSAILSVASSDNVVWVDGPGSTWTVEGGLSLGYNYMALLHVSNGGAVGSGGASVAVTQGASAWAVVTGAGSTWDNGGALNLGNSTGWSSNKGVLHIADGGTVNTAELKILHKNSMLSIAVEGESSLVVGNGIGTLTNNGTVRFLAGATATAGATYSPIAAGTWTGSGVYEALGGTWNDASHQFTVSEVQQVAAGMETVIDLTQMQRVQFEGAGDNQVVGLSFRAWTDPMEFNGIVDSVVLPSLVAVEATPMTEAALAGLEALLDEGKSVRGAWQFLAEGAYEQGDPVYLSIGVGPGLSWDGLEVWHYDGTEWTPFDATDLVYDGMYASFTVNGFSGYAVSGVPEPGTLALLLGLVFGMAVVRTRIRRA
ncbi:MAG: hypothetical protein JW818_15745 [Pirellulales bacterium]|nr:hypothetical protein [Pirellulales bacterium]